MKTQSLLFAALSVLSLAAATPAVAAERHVDISVGIGLPGYYPPPPVVVYRPSYRPLIGYYFGPGHYYRQHQHRHDHHRYDHDRHDNDRHDHRDRRERR